MIPHAVEVAPLEDLALFHRIERIIQELQNLELSDTDGKRQSLSCHLLCPALAGFFPVEVRDGLLLEEWEHSWLLTRNGLVIDPYPIAAVGGPLLLDTRYSTPWTVLYMRATHCSFPKHSSPSFHKNVSRVADAIRTVMQRFGIPSG